MFLSELGLVIGMFKVFAWQSCWEFFWIGHMSKMNWWFNYIFSSMPIKFHEVEKNWFHYFGSVSSKFGIVHSHIVKMLGSWIDLMSLVMNPHQLDSLIQIFLMSPQDFIKGISLKDLKITNFQYLQFFLRSFHHFRWMSLKICLVSWTPLS